MQEYILTLFLLPFVLSTAMLVFKRQAGVVAIVASTFLVSASILSYIYYEAAFSIGASYLSLPFLVFDTILLGYFAYIGFKTENKKILFLSLIQIAILFALESFEAKSGYDIVVDKLSVFMFLLINIVGSLILIYATRYIKDETADTSKQALFLAILTAFLGVMNMLVSADNIKWLFLFFELTTLASFWLIGFRDNEESKENARTALWMNQIGGVALLIAALVAKSQFHTVYISEILAHGGEHLMFFCALVSIAALIKGAQIPFSPWLLGAMVAPTPVSAILHSSTMVKIAPYLILKISPAIAGSAIGAGVAAVGAVSFLVSAALALREDSFKKILAYSTMSQLGYMFIAVGLGAYSSALFHVFTHAFFKALLFMGAGAIIVSLHHEQDIFKMGKMRFVTPLVYVTMLIATLALCGVPPFAGFFSKDEILLVAFANGAYTIWAMALLTAILTSYYMFRLFFVVFFGENATTYKHAHDVTWVMKAPLLLLAVGSALAGFLGLPALLGGEHLIGTFLHQWNQKVLHVSHETEWWLLALNIGVALLGILVAYKRFYRYDLSKQKEEHGLIYNKFFIDEVYDFLFVRSIQKLSVVFAVSLDKERVDRLVMALSRGVISLGHKVAWVQSAHVRFYAMGMIFGISAMSCYLLWVVG